MKCWVAIVSIALAYAKRRIGPVDFLTKFANAHCAVEPKQFLGGRWPTRRKKNCTQTQIMAQHEQQTTNKHRSAE